jgi:hypothetical protein
MTLGVTPRPVLTQGSGTDVTTFLENQAWVESKIVFGLVNVPGSNNDLVPWTNLAAIGATSADQLQEVNTRLAADLAWLETIFSLARQQRARAVVIGLQADMWDPAAAGAGQLGGYTEIVRTFARLAREFGKPVLLLNGDSHNFVADNPLENGDTFYGAPPVPNLTRITVQGGPDHFPFEYLRLTIDSRRPQAAFSWERGTPTLAP